MIITVNTDASYSHHWEVGGYAFWIVSDLGRIKRSGKLRQPPGCATNAEMRCIYNAMFVISRDETMMKYARYIIINTDCLNATYIIQNETKLINRFKLTEKRYKKTQEQFDKLIGEKFKGVKIEFRHVKAHVKDDSPRGYVNSWCDTEAKRHVGEYIAKNSIIRSKI